MREALLVRKRWVWILVLWVLVPAARDGRAQSNPGKLDYLLAELHDDLLATWPEQSTLLGYDSHATRWTDWSAQGLTERRQLFERYLRSLRDIPEAGLPPASRLNRRLAERALLSWIEGLSFDPYYLRLNPVNGLHLEVQQVLQAMPAESISDYEDILARLRQLPRLAGETVRLSEEGLAQGWVPPRLVLQETIRQLDSQLAGSAAASPLFSKFQRFPGIIPVRDRSRLQREANEIYRSRFTPAWRKLKDHISRRCLPQARDSLGLVGLPNGQALYASMISRHSSVPWTARQLHEFGLEEVSRLQDQLREWQKRNRLSGEPAELFRQLRTDRRFQFRSPDRLLAEARRMVTEVEKALPRLFAGKPEAPLVVRSMPQRLAPQGRSTYRPPAAGGRAPGVLLLRAESQEAARKFELGPIVLHEGLPGHHLQIGLQMEMEDIAPFRAFYPVAEFSEGWAHYAESLGSELGVYQDSYAEFGRLEGEMLRAARLVADTGVNAFGWNQERVRNYFANNLGDYPQGELERYIAIPGQALAYKLGEVRFRRLRQNASERLGAKFDIRQFHNIVLRDGMRPLDVVEQQIETWITGTENTETETARR